MANSPSTDKRVESDDTLRTTPTERRMAKKFTYFFKCIFKLFRVCKKKKKQPQA